MWMSAKLCHPVRANRGREALQRLGSAPKRRAHATPKPTGKPKTCSKKTFLELVQTIQHLLPTGGVEFWAMDEHRIGLKPIIRRVWSLRGVRPQVLVHHRYQWFYVYGFVHPPSGRIFWLLMPTASSAAFAVA